VIYLVHGIRTDGEDNIDRIGLTMTRFGHVVVDTPLDVRRAWNVRRTMQHDANRLAAFMAGDPWRERVIIAHSHGCNIALEAAKQTAVASLWLFNPATSSKYDLSYVRCHTEHIFCIYSPTDLAVRLGNMIPFRHPFGAAGYKGFADLPDRNNLESFGHHSMAFKEPLASNWGRNIHESMLRLDSERSTFGGLRKRDPADRSP